MADELKVLLCGTGENASWHVAESRWGRAEDRGNARITHVYGQDPERTEAFARKRGLEPVRDLESFLALGLVQGVDVCTVHDRHVPLARLAIRAGLPVLVEKPLAVSLEEGQELVQEAREKGVPLGVLYHKRYAPQHANLKRFIDRGGFGPGPIQVEMSIHHAAGDHYFRHGEYWKASVDQNGGGILMNQVVHYLDLLTWWLGPVKSVDPEFTVGQCSMEGESTARLRISFQAGHRADFLATVAVRKSLPVYWAAHGVKGSVVFHGMDLIRDTIGLEAQDWFRHDLRDKLLGAIPYRFRGKMGRPLSRQDDESAGTGWAEFFRAVSLGEEPPVTGREGLKVLELIDLAYAGQKPRVGRVPGMLPPKFGRSGMDYYRDLAVQEPEPDLLLINPLMISDYNRAHAHIHTHRPRPPLGLASAAAWLEQAGYSARLIDAAMLDLSIAETAELVREFNPRRVVLTTAQSDRWQNPDIDISPAGELIGLIKAQAARPVILLGPHGTATPRWTLAKTGADYLVRGEPERTLAELVQALDSGEDLMMIRGLAWMDEGECRQSLPRNFDDDLSGYPIPAFDQLPLTRYQYSEETLPKPFISMLSSRGCPARCVFCLKTMMPAKWRGQSAERVVSEMEYLKDNFNIRSVYFQDWEFLADPRRTRGLCRLLEEKDLGLKWGISTRVSFLKDPEYVKLLARAGCVLINCGYETGAQELLDKVDKGIKLDSARLAIQNCREAGIELRLFGLVNLPGETFSTIRRSVDFLAENGAEVVHPNLPIPYPTTRLWEMCEEAPEWDQLDGFEGRVQTRIKPGLALRYFKHLNRNRRFGRAYFLRPTFWRYLKNMGYFRLGRYIPGL